MVRMRHLAVAALVLTAGLVAPNPAGAGPLKNCLPDDGPYPAYSPLRYWAPGVARTYDDCHGPKLGVYPPDRHPEIVPTYTILKFPCPPALPAATLIPIPTPPAESKFRY
jgi:hypothetical protein